MAPADRYWLDGERVVVTAGGTREPIDPVRYIGNHSSGKMGNEIALGAARYGASVTLITAAQPAPEYEGIEIVPVDTAAQMHAALLEWLPGASILVMAAAVADFRPAHAATHKIKKSAGGLTLQLEATTDILTALREAQLLRDVFVVGFAAETENLVSNAQQKIESKGLDLIVVNDVGRSDIGMGSDYNQVTVLDRDGIVDEVARTTKHEVAMAILDDIHSKRR